MEKFIVTGPTVLTGTIAVAGAKNVALKALVATLLTDQEVILHNIPRIRDVGLLVEVLESLGKRCDINDNTIRIRKNGTEEYVVPLEIGARTRVSSMAMGPLLARFGKAKIPNPGGCRIGARPIDRQIEGLKNMGADIAYSSEDGYFHATTDGLHGVAFTFNKNTHTGTETLILAAVLAEGKTVLHNAAEEVEVDDLIGLLNAMGAQVKRTGKREITIEGVKTLHGTTYTVMPDRNEEVTFAVAAVVSKGDITVLHSQRQHLTDFLEAFTRAGGRYEEIDEHTTRYFYEKPLTAVDVTTGIHPGFMTDWQAPWALLMTQAKGVSSIHETVFENRFSYAEELKKMGADITFFHPEVSDPKEFYNFNWEDKPEDSYQAVRITGPTRLHNGILTMSDLRAGATLLLAAIIAKGKSSIYGIEQIDRGYEHIETRLGDLGASIERIQEDELS